MQVQENLNITYSAQDATDAVPKLYLEKSRIFTNKALQYVSCMLSNFQKHARRVYEILRLRNTDMSDEEKAREFRLEVKKRLYGPYRVSVCFIFSG